MTTPAQRETLARHLAAEGRHDPAASAATYVDDCYYESVPLGIRFTGRAAIEMQYAGGMIAMPDSVATHEGEVAEGNLIAHWGTFRATMTGPFLGLPPTGRAVTLPFAAIFEFDGDRMLGERVYFDLASLCEQAGIPIDDVRAAAATLRDTLIANGSATAPASSTAASPRPSAAIAAAGARR